MDHRAYKPYTLVGPPALRLVLDPLAVIFLNNRLNMSPDSHMKPIKVPGQGSAGSGLANLSFPIGGLANGIL